MTSKWEAELYHGMPEPNIGKALGSLWDQDTSAKKFTRTGSFSMSPEMYQAIQDIISHKNLPFNGSFADFERFANAAVLDALEEFLDENMRTIFRNLMTQQRRLTRERIVVTIDEVIDQQVEQLRFWTHRGKWRLVVEAVRKFVDELADYPEPEWTEYAADVWLHHAGVKAIMRLWSERMQDESPESWELIRKFTDTLELYANV